MEVPSLRAAATAACILLAALLLYRRLRRCLPPGPRPWPVVGNLYDVKPVRFRCYAEWAQCYGPIVSVWLGSMLNVVVSTTELAREVLKEKDQQLADRHRNRISAKFSRDGQDLIWADYGPHYVKVRKVCNLELFTPRRLEALRPIREDEVTAMVESIYRDCVNPERVVREQLRWVFDGSVVHGVPAENRGKSLTVRSYLGAVAFNNMTRLAFGKRFMDADGVIDAQGMEFKGISTTGMKLGASLSIAENIPWLRWLGPLEEEALARHGARRDRLTTAIMEEHTRLRQQSGSKAKQHFVDALLTLQKQYDLSDDTIIGLLWVLCLARGRASSLFLVLSNSLRPLVEHLSFDMPVVMALQDMITAGMDTTAISVEWAMTELIKNPGVQAKAQEELDRVVGRDRIMTEADFPNLPYLQWVAKEALRLHPPTPLMLPHKANADVKLAGYDVPKGSNVLVNVWAIARDPAVWKDPLEFRPERFADEDVDMKGHDFRLLPFGAGRRVCPGAQLGINIVQSILGHLLHQFRWEPPQGMRLEDIDMSENPGLVTYMHTPLQAVATPRLEATHLYKRVPFEM
ncbi:hypothetical protein Taro_043330 [Colocasia esculenta]|uniref:Uncharacterized protein n=1 Tax=Colocasia esculenta TaxID=4460 RepID=A0A843X0H0_COLES|nr:hypothetical protein [Colocasia esculenta]